MELPKILEEIDSLELFLSQQSERFFKLENEFPGEKNSFLSDLHKELAVVVKAVKTKVESQGITNVIPPKTEEKSESPKQEPMTTSTTNETSTEKEKATEETTTEQSAPVVISNPRHFHEMTENERINKFLDDSLARLEGTGPEWEIIKIKIVQWKELENGIHSAAKELIAQNRKKENSRNRKSNSAKPAKKAAAKKAAKKSSKKK